MELIYSALLLHEAKQNIDEANLTKVLQAAGLTPDAAKVKALLAALEGVDIEEAISKAAMPVATAAPAGEAGAEALGSAAPGGAGLWRLRSRREGRLERPPRAETRHLGAGRSLPVGGGSTVISRG